MQTLEIKNSMNQASQDQVYVQITHLTFLDDFEHLKLILENLLLELIVFWQYLIGYRFIGCDCAIKKKKKPLEMIKRR